MNGGQPRRCAVCDDSQPEILFRPRSSPGPVGRCRRCGLVYVAAVRDDAALIHDGPVLGDLDPKVLTSPDPDDLTGCWELSGLPAREAEWPAFRSNGAEALDQIERYVRPAESSNGSPRLLDYGCGWGFFLALAKERGWEPFGLEPLPAHAVYARSRSAATVVTDTLRDDTFPPGYFDAVTAFQVFEHLPDPAGAVARLHTLLKPGGVLLIEVPNIDTWSVRMLRGSHRHFVQDHLTFFSGRTLGQFVERHHFRVLHTYHPSRRMTIRHLVAGWGGRYLPAPVIAATRALACRLGLWERIICANLGDIVAVVARKES